MKKVLISSFDMGIGGVERSLISMLQNFDYDNYKVDLMLYRHQGEFMKFLSEKVNLLDEIDGYNSFGVPISNLIKDKKMMLATSRIVAKGIAKVKKRLHRIEDISYYQDQITKILSQPYLEKIEEEYDIAVSYVWPHYFIANKVKAKKKIAWIHTDYSTIDINRKLDLKMWSKFDYIISISEDCTKAFIKIYPELEDKIILMENITSPKFIKEMSDEKVEDLIQDEEIFNLVTVGRLSYAKGIDNAVKALNILNEKGIDNIRWYIVGYGPEESNIRQLIEEYNLKEKFILLGKKLNPYPYIKNCDLYVQPSRYEGKAVTITEAQILEKPILLTNYPTASSQVTNGIDGIITELSVDGIANGIEKMLNDSKLRDKLSKYNGSKDYGNSYELKKLYKLFD